jgi:hypothetical protein
MPADAVRPDGPPAKQGAVPVWVWLLLGGGLLFGLLLVGGVVATLFATGVLGGGPRLTVENVQRIQGGMTEAEVVGILGRPTERADGPKTSGQRTLTWRKGKEYITIVFRKGKVETVTDGYLNEGGRFGATK